MMKPLLTLAVAFFVALSACADPEQGEQQGKSQKTGPVVQQFGPGQMPDWASKLADDVTHLKALYQESLPLLENWLPGQHERGLELLREAADGGYAPAMAELGIQITAYPHLMAESTADGLRMIKMAATMGVPMAQFTWAVKLHEAGSPDEAQRYFDAVLADGDAEAIGQYGAWLLTGDFGQATEKQGFQYSLQAAEAGDAKALLNVGKVYLFGGIVPKNRDKAVEYFLKSAQAGNLEAAWRYSSMVLLFSQDPQERYDAWPLMVQSVADGTGWGAYFYGARLVDQTNDSCIKARGLGAAWIHFGISIAKRTGQPVDTFMEGLQISLEKMPTDQMKIYEAEIKKEFPSYYDDNFGNVDCKFKHRL